MERRGLWASNWSLRHKPKKSKEPFPREVYGLKTKGEFPRQRVGGDRTLWRDRRGETGREFAKNEWVNGCGGLTGSCVWALGSQLVALTGEVRKPFWGYSLVGGSTAPWRDLGVQQAYHNSCQHSLSPRSLSFLCADEIWASSLLPPCQAFTNVAD